MAEVTLEFIARQLDRLSNEVGGFRDDMMVVMARLDRADATTRAAVDEIRAMQSGQHRLARRVDKLETELRD